MKLLYFASLKESLETASEVIQASPNMTVKTLRLLLIERYGAEHFSDNILCAVNHEIVQNSTKLNEEDEVAFFPPVTGG